MSAARQIAAVMAGLVPAIHVLFSLGGEDVDARHKAGHDEEESPIPHFASSFGICHD
jgi:hypothetical protein